MTSEYFQTGSKKGRGRSQRSRVEDEIRSLIESEAWERCQVVDLAERESMLDLLKRWKAC